MKKSKQAAPSCICGKTVAFLSALLNQGFCSDRCYETAQKSGKALDEAHIFATSKGETYFQQGDLRFSVDAKDLNKVVGANGESGVLAKLMDSQIVSLAVANGLPVSPYVYELVSKPLIGLIQLVWYRDLEKHESDHLKDNQRKRVALYLKELAAYKPDSRASDSPTGVSKQSAVKKRDWSKSYRATGKKTDVPSGRAAQLLIVMKTLKQGTLAQIVEAANGKVQTKQDLQMIVARFLKELVQLGAVEEAP